MHRELKLAGLLVSLVLMNICCMGQGACPANIGFEDGSFNGWTCYDGSITTMGVINVTPGPPVPGIHTLYKNVSPQAKDTFGGFPVNCPNSSGYSIKLGNSGASNQVQRVSYTFTIPAGQNDYSIIFNYAVVLQNPGHHDYQQPKFTSKVFDVSAGKYLECGSFEFIAANNLPGFKESPVEKYIYYKDWAPVTIKLAGYAGKQIRLEFTVNDCTEGVHFGYAYLDVDENCSTPITGNTYCNGTGSIVLKAPYGFKEYRWFDDKENLLGNGNTLRLDPPPPGNTQFHLQIVPFPNQGCYDTLTTTVIATSDFMKLQVKDSIEACPFPGADLTRTEVTAGSTAGLNLEYYTDSTQAEFLGDPFAITKNGIYYIKGTSPSGCMEIRPVQVAIKQAPNVITQAINVCSPETIDLTSASVTRGSETGLSFSYWADSTAINKLSNPQTISNSGTYFIMGTSAGGCGTIKPVSATISPAPNIVLRDLHSCGPLLFNTANPTTGSESGTQFSFWADAGATINIPSNQVFTDTRTVYAKAIGSSGCSLIRSFQVNIHQPPSFIVTDPPPTTRPASVNLSTTVPYTNNWVYSYWLDSIATKYLASPEEVVLSGTYYIKATDTYGCTATNPVQVKIIDPPIVVVNAFSPNNDGVNDTWQIPILAAYANCVVEVYDRTGRLVYRSIGYSNPWDGKYNNSSLPVTTYYYLIRLTPDRPPVSGSVTILK